MGSVFRRFCYFMKCLFEMDHCFLQLCFFFILSTSIHTQMGPEWTWKENGSESMPEMQDGWVVFFWTESQLLLSSACWEQHQVQMTRPSTKCANTVLANLLCTILWAFVCARVRLLMAWIKCNHSSKHRADDLDLQDRVCSKQSVLLFCAANAASCMQNRCRRVHVKMPLPISIWIRPTCHLYPSSYSVNFDLTWMKKKKKKKD